MDSGTYCGIQFVMTRNNIYMGISPTNTADCYWGKNSEERAALHKYDVTLIYDPVTQRIASVRKNLKFVVEGNGEKATIYENTPNTIPLPNEQWIFSDNKRNLINVKYNKPINLYGGIENYSNDMVRVSSLGHKLTITELLNDGIELMLNKNLDTPVLSTRKAEQWENTWQWNFYHISEFYFMISFGSSSNPIPMPAKKVLTLKNNKLIYIPPIPGDPYQQWKLVYVNLDTQVKLLNRGTGKFLSVFHISPYIFPVLDTNDTEYAAIFTDNYVY